MILSIYSRFVHLPNEMYSGSITDIDKPLKAPKEYELMTSGLAEAQQPKMHQTGRGRDREREAADKTWSSMVTSLFFRVFLLEIQLFLSVSLFNLYSFSESYTYSSVDRPRKVPHRGWAS